MHTPPFPATVRRDVLLILLTLLLAWCYVLPRWADWSQNSRINLVRAIVEQGDVRIDAYVANTGDYALYNGHAYTDKAPGPAFVGLPLYVIAHPLLKVPAVEGVLAKVAGGGAMSSTLNPNGTGLNNDKIQHFVAQWLLTFSAAVIPSLILGVLLYLLLLQFGMSRGLSLLTTVGYGLATPAAAYAGNFYSHQFVAALLFGALFLLLNRPDRHWSRPLLLGLLLGFVVISEYPAALAVAALGIYALIRLNWRMWPALIIGGALPLLALVAYDLRAFGTPLPVGYSHSALWQNQHHTGFMSITYPRPEALWGLTFGTFRGVFIRAPWLVAAVPGLVIWYRQGVFRPAWWLSLWIVLTTVLFYASSVMWWGGFGVGPRYLVPILPFLSLAAAFALRPIWQHAAGKISALVLVIVSAGLTWSEALAHQGFPPDGITRPWQEYTAPAWQSGDLARNVGTAAGLDGALSILPLGIAVAVLLLMLAFARPVPPARPAQSVPVDQTRVPVRS